MGMVLNRRDSRIGKKMVAWKHSVIAFFLFFLILRTKGRYYF